MSDYIDRQAAIDEVVAWMKDRLNNKKNGKPLTEILRDLPSAQPEQKHGKWQITDAYPHNIYCSVCHKKFAQTHWAVWEDGSLPRAYCPNCGAKMEEEDE